jgi:HEPN domain-containing protein
MLNRLELQTLAKMRVREAKTLLRNGHFEGAYYLLGYAVECALKACIAKQIKKHDFPDKKIVNQSYTHELGTLFDLSGLKINFQKEIVTNSQLEKNWATVKDWKEESRYRNGIPEKQVKDFFSAVTARKNGILTWIKKSW